MNTKFSATTPTTTIAITTTTGSTTTTTSASTSTSSRLVRKHHEKKWDRGGDRDWDGDDHHWGHHAWADLITTDPLSSSTPSPTSTPSCPSVRNHSPSTTSLISSSESTAPNCIDSLDGSEQRFDVTSSKSVPLIVGLACGVLALVTCILALWWFLRRSRRKQILSHSKTILMTPRSTALYLTGDLESQRRASKAGQDDLMSEKAPQETRSNANLISATSSTMNSNLDVQSLNYSSTTSLPIPSSPVPFPTLGGQGVDWQASHTDTSHSHRFPRRTPAASVSQPTRPVAARTYSSTSNSSYRVHPTGWQEIVANAPGRSLTGFAAQSNDFYRDMFGLNVESENRIHQANPDRSTSSPCTSLPTSQCLMSSPLPMSSAPLTSVRPRSMAGSPRLSSAGASPRMSRESRRQAHPPPPPPPSFPPPAIPTDPSSEPQHSQSNRRRAATISSIGDGVLVNNWHPPASPSKARIVGGENTSSKGRRSRAPSPSSATRNLVVSPPNSLPPHRSNETYLRQQNARSNVLSSDDFVASLDQLATPLPLPMSCRSRSANTSRATSPSRAPKSYSAQKSPMIRPNLRQYHSHHGADSEASRSTTKLPNSTEIQSCAEREKAVQGIISDALAITTAKKEQRDQETAAEASDLDLQIMQTIQALREVADAVPGSRPSSP
ncbi:hypothetical protein BC939DRAFT_499371 [Gamsiella multidivaricata]|uniref:uncharacterized protein n=1 Tax=Gamsiella multidivaricata TaxID=101098 RepID=UPI00221FC3C4|nr:uncharacterized protein BC939DRAFT_499371 [Gamsiella multidivaricata]KAI7830660.1 hypothetical protein BC939DRAFT_499371 [Gamsiella multidivaricata]